MDVVHERAALRSVCVGVNPLGIAPHLASHRAPSL